MGKAGQGECVSVMSMSVYYVYGGALCMEHLALSIRVPIEQDNPSIVRDNAK